ncbi:MAG TPA: hypothetical protein VGS79_27260 [Puia sp.]|nr:hypothetical protein [Puia sp.]
MITRDNYEEFFLSYVDNELPAETRLAVEHFVAANPDLREELEMLVQCRLEPESDTLFPGKHNLLQYEESLLLYVDGELDEAGRKTVEEQTFREPRIGLELERLKMTVSEPDAAIVYRDKESLYHPVKRRRVVMMPWLQATAAAAVIGIVVVLLLPHGHKINVPATAVVKNNPAAVTPPDASTLYSGKNASTATPPDKPTLPAPAVAEKARSADNSASTMLAMTNKPTTNGTRGTNTLTHAGGATNTTPPAAHGTHPTAHPATASPGLVSTDPTAASGGVTVIAGTAPSNSTAALNSTAASKSTAASNSTATSNPATTLDPTTPSRTEKAAATLVAAVNIPKEQRSFATQALLREAQEEGEGAMADNMPPTTGKTKLRGLFRRVTRTFGKTADRDDDGQRQVSISVFQVALK